MAYPVKGETATVAHCLVVVLKDVRLMRQNHPPWRVVLPYACSEKNRYVSKIAIVGRSFE